MLIESGSDATKIALTFDDGPNPFHTNEILEILNRANVLATFFPIGKSAVRHPEIIKAVFSHGHDVGNHTFSHPSLGSADEGTARAEIEKCSTVISEITGQAPKFFRPPYGITSEIVERVVTSLDMKAIGWKVHGRDWENWDWESNGDTEAIINNRASQILAEITGTSDSILAGAIILLHDGSENHNEWEKRPVPMIRALPDIIGALQSRGFSLVKLSEIPFA